jgi:3-hydroxyacyl-CoA dehydrogenase/enoyl-CoA hydratase/3-hydroxybutyryl-CoA epimerase/enoyl-CoA isomerase
MIYEGQAINVSLLDDGIAQLNFDLQGESIFKIAEHRIGFQHPVHQLLIRQSKGSGEFRDISTDDKDLF